MLALILLLWLWFDALKSKLTLDELGMYVPTLCLSMSVGFANAIDRTITSV